MEDEVEKLINSIQECTSRLEVLIHYHMEGSRRFEAKKILSELIKLIKQSAKHES